MTELEKLRVSLMDNLKKIENNEVSDDKVKSLVSVSNQIIKTFNAELRADELSAKTKINIKNKVFENDKMQ